LYLLTVSHQNRNPSLKLTQAGAAGDLGQLATWTDQQGC